MKTKILKAREDMERDKGISDTPGTLNEKGIALVMVLLLSVIALAIMAGLIYMLTAGTQISGMQKRYRTALEAGVGGADVIYQFIDKGGDPGITGINFDLSSAFNAGCLTAKLHTPTTATNWAACTDYGQATSISIDPNDSDTYDTFFQLGTAPNQYSVFSKIVDTIEGNTVPGGAEGLIKGGVVSAGAGEVAVVIRPYLYTIEIDAQNAANPAERAKLSVLYQY